MTRDTCRLPAHLLPMQASSKLFNYVLRHSFTRVFLRVVYSAADPACPLSHYSLQASAEVFNYFLGGNKDQKTIEMGAPLAHNFTMLERKAGWGPGDWAPSGWTTVDRVRWVARGRGHTVRNRPARSSPAAHACTTGTHWIWAHILHWLGA